MTFYHFSLNLSYFSAKYLIEVSERITTTTTYIRVIISQTLNTGFD